MGRAATPARLVFFVVLAVYTVVYAARGVREPGAADGFYSYLYARSLAFDRDLDFANDYAVCGDPYRQGIVRGGGRVDNAAYPGPALFWTPLVLVARVTTRLPPDATPDVRAGCRGPIARAALASSMILGALAIAISFACARRFARPGIAAAVALLFAFASSLPQYAAIFVSSSHVHECFASALLLWCTLRAAEMQHDDPGALRAWSVVGAAAGLCALMRLVDVSLIAIPLALIVGSESSLGSKLRAAAVVALGASAGVVAMLSLYVFLYGSPFVLPQGRHFIQLGHAHPWLVLFAPHGGLLFTTPIAYLGFAGLVVARRASTSPLQRHFAIGAGLAMIACIYVAGAALDWHGKATFGARRLVVLVPLFVVLAATALEAAAPLLSRHASRLLAAAGILLFGIPVVGGVMGTTTGETPLEGGSQAEVYGGGARALFGALDSSVGDVAIWPAEAFYAIRFGLPMRTFRAATTDRHYRRSYRDLSWEPNAVDFRDPSVRDASSGLVAEPEGLRFANGSAKLVFTAGWPVATDARLELHADAPATIAFGIGTTFKRCQLGERQVAAGASEHAFSIPAGCFDSGLVELVLRGSREIVIRRLVLDDARALPPPF